MATRSLIAVRNNDSTYNSIYCHWDGYPEHHLPLLENHYNSVEKIIELLKLGNLSILDKSIECPEGHTFENPVKGHCVFYGRDRQEDNTQSVNYSNLGQLFRDADAYGAEFLYVFVDGKWVAKKI